MDLMDRIRERLDQIRGVQDDVLIKGMGRHSPDHPFASHLELNPTTGKQELRTYCNRAVFDTLRRTGIPTGGLGRRGRDGVERPVQANRMFDELTKQARRRDGDWLQVDRARAQRLADDGLCVVAAWKNPAGGHGHVATVRGMDEAFWGRGKPPYLNNVGTRSDVVPSERSHRGRFTYFVSARDPMHEEIVRNAIYESAQCASSDQLSASSRRFIDGLDESTRMSSLNGEFARRQARDFCASHVDEWNEIRKQLQTPVTERIDQVCREP